MSQPPTNHHDRKQKTPVHVVRIGKIQGSCWLNPGANGDWYTVTVSRTYRDDAGVSKTAQSYGRDDLPCVAEVCRQLWAWIHAQSQTTTPAEVDAKVT